MGQDLIRAAETRAQISQIEKYNTAVNTFYGKYGGLPEDLNASLASQFGFVARAGTQGRGDGNGIIEGYWYGGGNVLGWDELGEPGFFWNDLSTAKLIEGSFTTATDGPPSGTITNLDTWMPPAKLGNGMYIYVYSAGGSNNFNGADAFNYFGLSGVTSLNVNGNIASSALIKVSRETGRLPAAKTQAPAGVPLAQVGRMGNPARPFRRA